MRAENHYALIVGVSDYQRIRPLGGAVVRDTQAINVILTDPELCAYPAENVRTLINAEATYEAFCAALVWLAESTNEQSIVSIYFSGHGWREGIGEAPQTFLIPVDAYFDNTTGVLEKAVSGEAFSAHLRAIPARKLLVIFDCCHAGGIGQLKSMDLEQPLQFQQGLDETYYKELASGQGRAIVASSLESQPSAILPGDDNSLFTKHLLAGLQGGVRSTDGLIRVFELFSYVQQQVTAEYAKQSPFFQCALQDNFPVALYKAGKKEAYEASPILPTVTGQSPHYDFDVYISCVLEPDDNNDVMWVEETLIPRLTSAGIKVAWLMDSLVVGASKLDSDAVGMSRSRRTIVVISQMSLSDHWAKAEALTAQHIGIREGSWRVLPVYREAIDKNLVPVRLDMLSSINLASRRADREMQRLIKSLQSPLPTM